MPVLIPILKAGATVVTRVAPAVARRLIKAGKAKPAKGKPGEQLELDLKPPKKTPTPKPKSGKPGEQLELPLRGGGAKVTPKTKPKRKRTSGLKEAAIAGTVVGGAMAATAIALIGLFNMFGTQTAGIIGDKLRKKYILAHLYMARSIIFLIFFIVPVSKVSVIIFACTVGFLWLATVAK